MIYWVSTTLIGFGILFSLIAAIGLLRFDELFLKMHAATKVGTLGTGCTLLGVALQLQTPHALTEAALLVLFIAITNPISAHLIGKTYRNSQQEDQQKPHS